MSEDLVLSELKSLREDHKKIFEETIQTKTKVETLTNSLTSFCTRMDPVADDFYRRKVITNHRKDILKDVSIVLGIVIASITIYTYLSKLFLGA